MTQNPIMLWAKDPAIGRRKNRGGRAIVWATEWLIASGIALVVLRPLIWLPVNAIGLVVYLFVRPKARDALPDWRGSTNPAPRAADTPELSAGRADESAGDGETNGGRDREAVNRVR